MFQDASGKIIVYDAFLRDGFLYLVSTFYHHRDVPHIILFNGIQAEIVGYNEGEPVCYYRVPCNEQPTIITIDETNYTFSTPIDVLSTADYKGGLAIATLFKHDYKFIPYMVEWYRTQGFTAFYLYFNGSVLPPDLYKAPDIYYRLWNFPYWNRANYLDKETGWVHNAQPAFLTTARLRYLPNHDWIGFVDIDEMVMSVDGRPLNEALCDISVNIDCVRVQNHWAFRATDYIVYTLTSYGIEGRTKCFYRGSYTGLCSIHRPKGDMRSLYESTELRMLHIVNFTHMNRLKDVTEPKATLSLKNLTPFTPPR